MLLGYRPTARSSLELLLLGYRPTARSSFELSAAAAAAADLWAWSELAPW